MTRYVAVLLVAGSIACGSTNQAATTTRPSLPPVAMPDIANAAPDVQTRLRERYASLTRTINDARTSASAVAEAYGEMGKLFLAAEYFEPAERCFLNAASLAPSEMRWATST